MNVIRRILSFVRQYWYMFILAFICLAIGTGLGILIPNLLGDGIDAAVDKGNRTFLFFHFSDSRSMIFWLAGILISTSIIRGFSGYGQRYYNEALAQQTTYFMRNALYERIQRLSFSFHDKSQTGQLMSRATVDIEAVRMFIATGILGMLQIIIMLIVVAYLLLVINRPLALLMLAFVVPVCWLAIMFHRKIRPIWLKVQAVLGYMGTTLEESLAGISVVKAFSHEKEDSRDICRPGPGTFRRADTRRQADGHQRAHHGAAVYYSYGDYPVVRRAAGGGRKYDHRAGDRVYPLHRYAGDAGPPAGDAGQPLFPHHFRRAAYHGNPGYQVRCHRKSPKPSSWAGLKGRFLSITSASAMITSARR